MTITVKRVYDPPSSGDGQRVLVDRVWPRGLRKEQAAVDCWLKEVAPSSELRKWFGHDPARWDMFRRRYFTELDQHPETVEELRKLGHDGRLTLLFGAKETRYNNAVALQEYLQGKR